MSMKVLMAAAVMLALCQSTDSSAAHYPTGKNRPCCVESTNRNLSSQVVGNTYSEQRSRSHCVEAIIFSTAKGPICVNPKALWAKRRMTNMTKEE